jgi:phytanoyl-CoA hydroxylase
MKSRVIITPIGAMIQPLQHLLFATAMPTVLTCDRLDAWQHHGLLVLPGFADASAIASLTQRAREIVDAFEPSDAALFSSRDRARLNQSALAASAGEVRCFFEEEAFDGEGRLVVAKSHAINKIGHALHDRDPVFDHFSRDPRLARLAEELGVVDPLLMQSMLIFKQPRIGGEVVWHQDASFLITEPNSVVGFWWALEDATRNNGCLWVADQRGPLHVLRERYVRHGDGFVTEPLDATPWPSGSDIRPLEVKAGTLVVFDGLLPHASAPNRSARSRLAYSLHIASGRAAWSPLNWLQRSEGDPARGFY